MNEKLHILARSHPSSGGVVLRVDQPRVLRVLLTLIIIKGGGRPNPASSSALSSVPVLFLKVFWSLHNFAQVFFFFFFLAA